MFEFRLLQQVLRFVVSVYIMQYVELMGYWMGGATSQLDLPSLTQLSIAGCGRPQLGVPHWAASVDYLK